MARKEIGYIELHWTCPNCQGINPGSEETCMHCGAPQPEDVQFFQPTRQELITNEEKLADAAAGPDIHCPYCNARNRGDAETCSQCGGDLVEGVKREAGKVVGAFETGPETTVNCPQCGAPNPDTALMCEECGGSLVQPVEEPPKPVESPVIEPAEKRGVPTCLVIFLVVLCIAAAVFIIMSMRTDALTGTVEGVRWERTIAIEALVDVQRSDWFDEIPDDAELLGCIEEVRYVQTEYDPNAIEVCGTPYSVETGSGFAQVVQDCEYHVLDDYCEYAAVEWREVDTVTSSGADMNPVWPEAVAGFDQQLGEETETYFIYFDTPEGDFTYSTKDYYEFLDFSPGSQWTLEVNSFGSVVSIGP